VVEVGDATDFTVGDVRKLTPFCWGSDPAYLGDGGRQGAKKNEVGKSMWLIERAQYFLKKKTREVTYVLGDEDQVTGGE